MRNKKVTAHLKGGEATLKKHGAEHYRKMGRKTLKKYGKEHFQKIALKRWEGVKNAKAQG